jgi:hypothetical protein
VFRMMRAAVLHPVEPTSLGTNVEVEYGVVHVDFHRIAGFGYVGCHDRKGFEEGKGNFSDWTKHRCFQNGNTIKVHVV